MGSFDTSGQSSQTKAADRPASPDQVISPSLLRIIREVLNDTSGALEESLSYDLWLDPFSVVQLDEQDIDSLTSAPGITMTRSRGALSPSELATLQANLNRVPLHKSKKKSLMVLKGYFWWYQHEHGRRPDFDLLTRDDFDSFRISPHWNPDYLFTTIPVSSSQSKSSRLSPADEFKQGIKRDQSHYTVFKDEKQWDAWRRATISTARAHGCEEIFDPKYRPTSPDSKALFAEKQKFMYSVFETILKTDMGKYFVHQHEKTFDAQAVYKKLALHASTSTQAAIDSSAFLTYLTSAKFDSHWRGTAQSFVLNWCDKLRAYEDLIGVKDCFSDLVKLNLL